LLAPLITIFYTYILLRTRFFKEKIDKATAKSLSKYLFIFNYTIIATGIILGVMLYAVFDETHLNYCGAKISELDKLLSFIWSMASWFYACRKSKITGSVGLFFKLFGVHFLFLLMFGSIGLSFYLSPLVAIVAICIVIRFLPYMFAATWKGLYASIKNSLNINT
jgi:hypothetical protein